MSAASSRDAQGGGHKVMRLHIVRASLATPDGAGATGATLMTMDAAVWSRLPDDILWRVLLLLPAAKHFQLQCLSRKWRHLLTSAEFRKAIAAATAAAGGPDREQQQQRVVACVTPRNHGKLPAVDIDLSFLPSTWSWKPYSDYYRRSSQDGLEGRLARPTVVAAGDGLPRHWSYSIVAAGDGLLCIANCCEPELREVPQYSCGRRIREAAREGESRPWTNQYCVLNPVTRTCVVLPSVPFRPWGWLPPTAARIAMYGYRWDGGRGMARVYVATYDLATGGAGGWVSAVHDSELPRPTRRWEHPGVVAMFGGETFWYYKCRVHVLAPSPDGRHLLLEAALDDPSLSRLGPDAAARVSTDHGHQVFLVPHRGALFFVARGGDVWRLARARLEWEPVAMLDFRRSQELTGLGFPVNRVCGAWGARELLCCQVVMWSRRQPMFVLGVNLDTAQWEVVLGERGKLIHRDLDSPGLYTAMKVMELRPDLFLSM